MSCIAASFHRRCSYRADLGVSNALDGHFMPHILLNSTIPPPTLCIGAPVLHYVMGGGWELCTQDVLVKRARDTPPVTLPYLTLPYLTLPYLTLPYLTLVACAAGWLSMNPGSFLATPKHPPCKKACLRGPAYSYAKQIFHRCTKDPQVRVL